MSENPYLPPNGNVDDVVLENAPDFSQRWGRFLYLFFGGGALAISSIVMGFVVDIIGDESGIIRYLVFSTTLAFVSSYRFRDFGVSGWFSLTAFLPGINILMFFALLFVPGNRGKNKYGYTWSRENQEKYGLRDV